MGSSGKSTEIRNIALDRLLPHPMNANVMGKKALAKLRRHIERTGRYEPLVVRPHPTRTGGEGREGAFELINGHHRKRVLESLGHKEAACVVWDLDDRETLLLLATVNRLSGTDNATKRLRLLEELGKEMEAEALAAWVPEDEATLRALLAASEAPPLAPPAEAMPVGELPEAFTVFLKACEKERLVAALARTDADAAVALMRWVEKCENVER